MNKVTVKINNADYVLKGEESEEYLNQIGFNVNKMISNMVRANSKLNVHDAAILTSCNLLDEKFKSEEAVNEIRKNNEALKAENSSLREEIESLKFTEKLMAGKMSEMKILDQSVMDEKENEIRHLQGEIRLLKESVGEYREDNEKFSRTNKELKFELQSYKYKVLDLQNKLFEMQTVTPRSKRKEEDRKEDMNSVSGN